MLRQCAVRGWCVNAMVRYDLDTLGPDACKTGPDATALRPVNISRFAIMCQLFPKNATFSGASPFRGGLAVSESVGHERGLCIVLVLLRCCCCWLVGQAWQQLDSHCTP